MTAQIIRSDTTRERGLNEHQTYKVVIIYPLALIFIVTIINYFLLEPQAVRISLPPAYALTIASVTGFLLIINHSILMTVTEIVRTRYRIHATAEEYQARGDHRDQVSQEGWLALERCHGTHRNCTENTVYFACLSTLFLFTNPGLVASYLWLGSFGLARLGHAIGYLSGRDGIRGLFMTLSLLSVYGLSVYLLMGLLLYLD